MERASVDGVLRKSKMTTPLVLVVNKTTSMIFPTRDFNNHSMGLKSTVLTKQKAVSGQENWGGLDNHLNLNPQDENKQLEGCEFAEIKCNYCSEFFVRIALLNHKVKFCDKRPFSCEYCTYKSTYDDMTRNHWPVCGHHPVQCPNNCGAFSQRQNLESHVVKDCPLTVVECEFHYAGCEVKLPRKDMPDHLQDGLNTHFSLLVVSHKKQQNEIKEIKALNDRQQNIIKEVKALNGRQKDEIRALTEEVNQLKLKTGELKLHTEIVPVELKVKKPLELFGLLSKWSSSTPFYSHSQGYKLRIGVCNDVWTGAYFIRVYLMQGEFDDSLKWPLDAVIVIHVLSRQSKDLERRIRLYNKDRVGNGGTDTYGGTDIGRDLSPHLHNGCLHIRIINVHFLSQ